MATDKFVFCAMHFPVERAISTKASFHHSFLRPQRQPGASCVFRRTAQPSGVCGAL